VCTTSPTPPATGLVQVRSTGSRYGPYCPELQHFDVVDPSNCPEVQVKLNATQGSLSIYAINVTSGTDPIMEIALVIEFSSAPSSVLVKENKKMPTQRFT
jgi:hypothetical protein